MSFLLTVSVFAKELSNTLPSPYEKELDSVVYADIDYLLWFTNQNGFHSPTVATGKSPDLNSPWSSGVRALIGAQPARWDIQLCYTYYSTSSSDTVRANIEPILTSTPSTAGIFEVEETWNVDVNRIDLHLGRKILCGSYFLVEPFFGLEGLGIPQKFHLKVNTIFLDLATDEPATDVVFSKNRNSWLGIGPSAGFKAEYAFKAGFGFYGHLGVNILWGVFNIKQNYSQTDYYSSGNSTLLVDQVKKVSQDGSILATDLEIGFNWRYLFQKPHLELALKLGWEQHYYIDIIRFHDFYLQQLSLGTAAYTTHGNLTLSGLTAGVLLRY